MAASLFIPTPAGLVVTRTARDYLVVVVGPCLGREGEETYCRVRASSRNITPDTLRADELVVGPFRSRPLAEDAARGRGWPVTLAPLPETVEQRFERYRRMNEEYQASKDAAAVCSGDGSCRCDECTSPVAAIDFGDVPAERYWLENETTGGYQPGPQCPSCGGGIGYVSFVGADGARGARCGVCWAEYPSVWRKAREVVH